MLFQNRGFVSGLGLEIHVRTKINTWWSFIETAAIRIGNDILEVTGGRLGETALTKEAALLACGHVQVSERAACVFDTLATNDMSMAEAYSIDGQGPQARSETTKNGY